MEVKLGESRICDELSCDRRHLALGYNGMGWCECSGSHPVDEKFKPNSR